MIKEKTILILGAGASNPYGLPLGRELRDSVIRAKSDIVVRLKSFGMQLKSEKYDEFSTALAHSGYPSVDAYLEDKNEWLEIGKAAISVELFKAEFNSKQNLFPPNQPKDHWYEVLWKHLKAPTWSQFKKNQVAIISFNYDRSLEHYLVTILCNNYGISPVTAINGLLSFPLLHVHGDLGDYIAEKGYVDFGNKLESREQLVRAKSGIQIVHEKKSDTRDFILAINLLDEARRILFIGFGFHPKNMAKLNFDIFRELNKYNFHRHGLFQEVYGTHKGIKTKAWARLCIEYGFNQSTMEYGAGSISDFIDEIL